MRPQPLTEADLTRLPDDQLHALERATSRMGDELQRQAARYQRQADRMRKAMKSRARLGRVATNTVTQPPMGD